MIVIIKYNAGNVESVQNALQRLGYESIISDDPAIILSADKVIFPGVGEASSAMEYLINKGLDQVIRSITSPFLGICLGLQLMCKSSDEGKTKGLGIFDTEVKLFPPQDIVPHMGWNNFESIKGALYKNVNKTDDVYYVHSYYAELCEDTVATCNYITPFSASLHRGNFYAAQFHPEKSAKVGSQILKNFLEL
jgi:glutamine amidotransferase